MAVVAPFSEYDTVPSFFLVRVETILLPTASFRSEMVARGLAMLKVERICATVRLRPFCRAFSSFADFVMINSIS